MAEFGKDRDDVRSHNQVKCYPSGSAQGGAAIQAVSKAMSENGGSTGYKTVIRETREGRAIARSRDGMPMVTVANNGENLYMETGQLEFSFPGDQNATNFSPGTWHFLDISPTANWLGEIDLSDDALGAQEAPQPTPVIPPPAGILVEGCDSLSIGYPRSANSGTDAVTKASYGASTVVKKVVTTTFPPALFPGKMRLFIQAQYGAMEEVGTFRYRVETVGSAAALMYTGTDEAYAFQLGFWAHGSCGLFTDADFNYYVINITTNNPGTCVLTGIPLMLSDAGEMLKESMFDAAVWGAMTDDEKRQLEAYVLSDAIIDTKSRFNIGTFDAGELGGTLCYGWKFNWDGSEAAVVSVWMVGDELQNNRDNRSNEVHLTITKATTVGTRKTLAREGWTLTGTSSGVQNWRDFWGDWHIFAPTTETTPQLELWSCSINFHGVAPYAYSNVAIYGWYKDQSYASPGTWAPVTVSYTAEDTTVKYISSYTGLEFDTYAQIGGLNTSGQISSFQKAACHSVEGYAWEAKEQISSSKSEIKVCGVTFEGERSNGYVTSEQGSVVAIIPGNHWVNVPPYGNAGIELVNPAYQEFSAQNLDYGAMWVDTTVVQRRRESVSGGSYEHWKRWALVVPYGDCEGVLLATQELNEVTGTLYVTTGQRQDGPQNWGAKIYGTNTWVYGTIPWVWVRTGDYMGALPSVDGGNPVTNQPDVTQSKFFSRTLATETTDPQSYYTLFTVDSGSPVYNGLITLNESAGRRYYTSEGLINPASATAMPFIGWA